MPRLLPPNPADALRRRRAREVHSVFHSSASEPRVVRSPHALIAPDSVAWRVHGDVTTMIAGGIAALLQMLHPAALAGVWDHSDFETDMLGRLRRTARFIAVTPYASCDAGEAIIERVARIHDRVGGTLPDGRPYSANDPETLAFVHVAGAVSFLDAFVRFVEPGMARPDQDRYFAEVAGIARALGANPVPTSRAGAESLLDRYRPELVNDERTRRVRDLILGAAPKNGRGAGTGIIDAGRDRLAAALCAAAARVERHAVDAAGP